MRAIAHSRSSGGVSSPVLYGDEQPLGDQVVLTIAERAERDDALDDLAGARIGDAAAGAPAARRSVHPVDDVVADVERADAVGQHLDLKGVAVACRLERLVPPARALDERRADRLRRAGIDVVDDRLHRLADRGLRVLLLQPVPRDELLRHRARRAARRSPRRTRRSSRRAGPRARGL